MKGFAVASAVFSCAFAAVVAWAAFVVWDDWVPTVGATVFAFLGGLFIALDAGQIWDHLLTEDAAYVFDGVALSMVCGAAIGVALAWMTGLYLATIVVGFAFAGFIAILYFGNRT